MRSEGESGKREISKAEISWEKQKEAITTVLSLVTEEIPEFKPTAGRKWPDWFFDIYIQGSNTTFLELSLKQEFQLS